MISRSACRAFLAEGDPVARLRACLEPLNLLFPPSAEDNDDPGLRLHVQQLSCALSDAATSPITGSSSLTVSQINDNFFEDLCGKSVEGADYAFAQLLGPEGPYFHAHVRAGISFQGAGLLYKCHHHEAQELYIVLDGSSGWWTDRTPEWEVRERSWHIKNEAHAMATTANKGALFFWSWTGNIALEVKHSHQDPPNG